MNPISNPNNQFSHDSIKYVYQEPDMRMVNQTAFNVKPFKVPEKKNKKESDKKKKGDKENPSSGLFDLF